MSCKLEIDFSGDSVIFGIYNCTELKSLNAIFPKTKTKFFGGTTYGLSTDDGRQYVIVQDNGYMEYITRETEVQCNLPLEIATEFVEYVKERVGQRVTEKIQFAETENPQVAGNRKKTRRKKSKCLRSKNGC